MARDSVLREGSSVLTLGIFLIAFGVLMDIHQTTGLMNYLTSFFGDTSLADSIGLIIVLIGAVLTVYGISMSVSGIVEAKLERERAYLTSSVATALLPEMRKELESTLATKAQRKCKFCGAELQAGVKFCPSCGKAQT